jgi:hypothetical protein
MEFLRLALLFLHFGGLAAAAAGLALRLTRARAAGPVLLAGALTLLITGPALVAVDHALDRAVNDAKAGVKLAVLLAILALVVIDRRRELPAGAVRAVGLLTAANVAVAVFWT